MTVPSVTDSPIAGSVTDVPRATLTPRCRRSASGRRSVSVDGCLGTAALRLGVASGSGSASAAGAGSGSGSDCCSGPESTADVPR